MSKIAVVYWSATGNTEEMAKFVAEGAQSAGAEVEIFTAADVPAGLPDHYDAVAFGCPAMGAETLEEGEFEPMFEGLEGSLSGKKIALFGSYGWGGGAWMEDWTERCKTAGALVCSGAGLAVCGQAAGEDEEACRRLGADLAAM